jgi:hypothetical protein
MEEGRKGGSGERKGRAEGGELEGKRGRVEGAGVDVVEEI